MNEETLKDQSKRFNTIPDILEDEQFEVILKKIILDVLTNRRIRPAAPEGTMYRRTWLDRMIDNGDFRAKFFKSNIEDILMKKSKLNAEYRKVIEFFCNKAFGETIQFYNTSTKIAGDE